MRYVAAQHECREKIAARHTLPFGNRQRCGEYCDVDMHGNAQSYRIVFNRSSRHSIDECRRCRRQSPAECPHRRIFAPALFRQQRMRFGTARCIGAGPRHCQRIQHEKPRGIEV